MKLSAFVSITRPEERQDPWRESLLSVLNWADELVVVCGDGTDEVLVGDWLKKIKNEKEVKLIYYHWPEEFSWDELPKHLNKGLEATTGDWAVRFDIDYVFPENWKDEVKVELEKQQGLVASFQKISVVTVDKAYQKGATVMAINRSKLGVAFGKAEDDYTDMCVPILVNRREENMAWGKLVPRELGGRCGLEFMNYDYSFKTKEFTKKEFLRFSKAHKKAFGESKWGESEEEALKAFVKMMKGRSGKIARKLKLENHPVFIRERIKNMTKDQFGFDGWGELR